MADIRLYINKQEVDITNIETFATQFAFTMEFNDLYEPDKVKDTYSKSVTLAGTPNNNRIFGEIWNMQGSNLEIFNPAARASFNIDINGTRWKTGTAKLDKVHVKGSLITYDITFYGQLGGLFNDLLNNDVNDEDNKLLQSLLYSGDLRHTLNTYTIAMYWANPLLYDFCYVPCLNGLYDGFNSEKWLTTDASSNKVVCDVAYHGKQFNNAGISWDEYQMNQYRSYYQRPALKVENLLQHIKNEEQKYPFIFNDGTFFSLNNPYYRRTVFTLPQYAVESQTNEIVLTGGPDWNPSQYFGSRDTDLPEYDFYFPITGAAGAIDVVDGQGWIDPSDLTGTDMMWIEFEGKFEMYLDPSQHRDYWNFKFDSTSSEGDTIKVEVVAIDQNGNESVAVPALNTGNDTLDAMDNSGFWSNRTMPNYLVSYFDRYELRNMQEAIVYGYDMTAYDGYKPFLQKLDITGMNTKFKLYIRVSELDKLGFEGQNTLSGEWSTFDAPFRITFRRIQKTQPNTLGGKFGFNASDARITYTSGIRSGARVSKYDMMDTEYTQGEFILGYTKLFGMLWETLPSGMIELKSRNKFFEGYRILDWTEKVDRSQDIEIVPNTFSVRTMTMKYEDGKTRYEDEYRSKNSIDYGEQRLNTGYQFNSDSKALLEGGFTNTVMAKENNSWYGESEGQTEQHDMLRFILPAYYSISDGKRNKLDVSRNLLFFAGQQQREYPSRNIYLTDDAPGMTDEEIGGGDDPCWLDPTPDTSTYWRTVNTLPLFTTHYSDKVSLDIGKPKTSYEGLTDADYQEYSTVFARFWQKYLLDLYSPSARVMTAYIKMSASDIVNFTFRDFVVIDNVLYHPNKIIDLNPLGNKPVKVELIKVQNIDNYVSGQNLSFV